MVIPIHDIGALPSAATGRPTSFAAERTLGRLAKLLRLMGFDTLLEIEYPKGSFLEQIGPDRVFLTRTQRMANSAIGLKTILLHANAPWEQVSELIHKTDIRPEDIHAFSRCTRCNVPIVAVPKLAVQAFVPEYVWNHRSSFSRCSRCGRVYWRGSHTERALKRLSEIISVK
jgi:uncharacterized protein with PIN domain